MAPRRAKQKAPPLRLLRQILVSVPTMVEGFYWYVPRPGDPLYDAHAPGHGAEVTHVTSRPHGEVDVWFTGNPQSIIMGTLGYFPEQFVGPLVPPSPGADVDV